jgi:DNA-binding transcriptional ArsR family regulator
MDDVTLEALFYALSNETRLQIIFNLYQVHQNGGQALNCALAVENIEPLAPSTTSHHFRILREGGLVRSERAGKDCNNSLRMEELNQKFPGLLPAVLELLNREHRSGHRG